MAGDDASRAAERDVASTPGGTVTVDQPLAIAVQDATDFLRATMTLAVTAYGAGMAQFLSTGDSRHFDAAERSHANVDHAIAVLERLLDLNRRGREDRGT